MMDISSADIKKLRDTTGAGMMDCKKALAETKGDFEAAIDFLRKKGLALAASKSGRVAAEGAVAVHVDGTKGALIELNSETDFVARNLDFQALVKEIATMACTKQCDFDALKASTDAQITELVATIKENMQLRRSQVLSVGQGVIASYIHNAYAPDLGKIGVLVALESAAPADTLYDLGKKIAMHIAAIKPKALTVERLPADIVAREKEIFADQARASGRPEEIVQKMIEGRMRKFYEESVLLEQVFVLDGKLTVKEFIATEAKRLGTNIEMKDYAYFILGDGIEKETVDFAAEVMAQIK
ncbi:MAG: translation elongation factor Ts [Pseudomonadota bacterium]